MELQVSHPLSGTLLLPLQQAQQQLLEQPHELDEEVVDTHTAQPTTTTQNPFERSNLSQRTHILQHETLQPRIHVSEATPWLKATGA